MDFLRLGLGRRSRRGSACWNLSGSRLNSADGNFECCRWGSTGKYSRQSSACGNL